MRVFIQCAYYKTITETPSIDKLSAVVPWSKVIIISIREQCKDKTGIGFVKTKWDTFSAAWSIMPAKSKSESQ